MENPGCSIKKPADKNFFLYKNRQIQRYQMIRNRALEGADTGTFVQVATVTDLENGRMIKIRAGGQDLLLVRVDDRYYCMDAYCPHLGGNLSEGHLSGTILTCPLHHSQFDITDGHVLRWTDLTGSILVAAKNQRPPRPLMTYPVKIEGNAVFVKQ